MSYILEALKKAEQQRELGSVPGIDAAQETPSQPRRSRWWWVLGSLLLLNLLLVAVLMWPAPAQRSAPVADAGRDLPPRAPLAGADGSADPAAAAVPPPASPRPAAARPVSPSPPAPLPAARSAAVVAAAPAPVSAPPRRLPPQPAPAPARSLPVWPQIPTALFNRLQGGLQLDVHVYDRQPGRRFVLLNLRKYREGEQLREGPLLEEITPDGVILSFQGERFRVLAQ